jgi:hypothetical protein
MSPDDRYEVRIRPAREEVLAHPTARALLDPGIDPAVLERFLIQWCALGVQITEPVEGWIRRAGERCWELGLAGIAMRLQAHAHHEANHHLMFLADTRALVERWNLRQRPRLAAGLLLAQPATPAMRDYIQLHEDTIAGEAPYAQVAIEYEVEGLSVSLLPRLLEQFRRVLGPEVMASLSFLREHAALDVGHTRYNRQMIQLLAAARPAAVAGTYLRFLGECLAVAADPGQISARPRPSIG